MELPVDILSHEFKAKPKLFDYFKKYDVSKKYAWVCVDQMILRVETIDEIIKTISQKGINVFDDKISSNITRLRFKNASTDKLLLKNLKTL